MYSKMITNCTNVHKNNHALNEMSQLVIDWFAGVTTTLYFLSSDKTTAALDALNIDNPAKCPITLQTNDMTRQVYLDTATEQ